MTLYEWVSRGCANDEQRRAKANELADKAHIHRGLMGRYLRGDVTVGAKNARRIELATNGDITIAELLYPAEATKAS